MLQLDSVARLTGHSDHSARSETAGRTGVASRRIHFIDAFKQADCAHLDHCLTIELRLHRGNSQEELRRPTPLSADGADVADAQASASGAGSAPTCCSSARMSRWL